MHKAINIRRESKQHHLYAIMMSAGKSMLVVKDLLPAQNRKDFITIKLAILHCISICPFMFHDAQIHFFKCYKKWHTMA